jgi:hypothetical protein
MQRIFLFYEYYVRNIILKFIGLYVIHLNEIYMFIFILILFMTTILLYKFTTFIYAIIAFRILQYDN